MGAMQPWHWIVVIVVLVILFGSKKLPDAARGLGRSLRIFKSEMGEMTNDGGGAAPEKPKELPAADQGGTGQSAAPAAERQPADRPADS